ncbi:MAG: hypothetical protein SNH55_08460 [Rikenellaceae bacterium]
MANGSAAGRMIQKVSMLGSKESIAWSRNSEGLTIVAPQRGTAFEEAVVYKVKLK